MTFLDAVVVGGGGAASVAFSAISAAYRHLLIVFACRSDDGATQALLLQFNGDTTANYDWEAGSFIDGGAFAGNSAGATSIRVAVMTNSSGSALAMAAGSILLPYYSTTTQDKSAVGSGVLVDPASANRNVSGGAWRTANAAITGISIFPAAGSFVANSSFSLYGIT